MQSPSVVQHQAISSPSPTPLLERVDAASPSGTPAANDEATSSPRERRLNPLWAINVALASFLVIAALIIASG
jgi:hypothetical protein